MLATPRGTFGAGDLSTSHLRDEKPPASGCPAHRLSFCGTGQAHRPEVTPPLPRLSGPGPTPDPTSGPVEFFPLNLNPEQGDPAWAWAGRWALTLAGIGFPPALRLDLSPSLTAPHPGNSLSPHAPRRGSRCRHSARPAWCPLTPASSRSPLASRSWHHLPFFTVPRRGRQEPPTGRASCLRLSAECPPGPQLSHSEGGQQEDREGQGLASVTFSHLSPA